MLTTYNPTHILIIIQRKTFYRTTIHIAHLMCLMIGYYNPGWQTWNWDAIRDTGY
jgi:hypothetical protein